MNKPQSGKPSNGGTEAQRGFVFQTYSVLLYLLLRRIELSSSTLGIKDLRTFLEPEEGEDAKFISLVIEGDAPLQVTELVQCKKIEQGTSAKIHAGLTPDDVWPMGSIAYTDFEQWLLKKRDNQSAIDILAANPHMFFTALVFGEPTKRVDRFVPKGIRNATGLHWYSPTFTKAFPINYMHPADPAVNAFATADIRRRIRVLVVGSPTEMQSQCELLLRTHFEVNEDKAPEIVRRLRAEIQTRSASRDSSSRSLSHAEIEHIIATGKNPQGKWQTADQLLRRAENSRADLNRGESLGFADFAEKGYAHRSEFDEAWRYLNENGAVVISGRMGSGRTTMARFLAYKFLSAHPEQRAYFLAVRPIESYIDEIRFFKSHLFSETLFIVDDQNLAVEKIEELAQAFMDFRLELKAKARLVITSTITYSPTQATARSQTRSVLNQIPSVHLRKTTEAEISQIIQTLKDRSSLDTPLTGNEVASLSQNNIGLGLFLARCAHDLGDHLSADRIVHSRSIGKLLREWILDRLGRRNETDFFVDQIVPVFIIASHGLPIPHDFNQSVSALVDVGILRSNDPSGNPRFFYATNARLAFIMRQQYSDLEFTVLSEYLRSNPKLLPVICEQLNSRDADRPVLHDLAEAHFADFVAAINDDVDPIDLEGISNILDALYTSHRPISRRLLRILAFPGGQPNLLFFVKFIRLGRIRNARSLRRFFQVLDRVDRAPVRQLAFDQLGYQQLAIIRDFLESDWCSLDEVAASLHSIMRCSRQLAKSLYDSLSKSPIILNKMTKADEDPDGLSIWLRFCEELQPLDRNESKRYLEEHLNSGRIIEAMLKNEDFSPWSRLLLRLRRLRPKSAAELSFEILSNHVDTLERRLRAETRLVELTNDLYALSRINRRMGVLIARRIMDHINGLVAQQEKFNLVGTTLDSLRTNLSLKLAQSALASIKTDNILANLKAEDFALDLVGKFLVTLHSLSIDLAAWFENNLDYSEYLRRTSARRLTDLAYLMRGLLIAAAQQKKVERLARFLSEPLWLREFRRLWDKASTLSEQALCISLLLDIPIEKKNIFQVLSFPNINAFEEHIFQRLQDESDTLHIANYLYAIAKLDFVTALEALRRYVERIEVERSSEKAARQDSHSARTRPRSYPSYAYSPDNLAHVGYLLQIAASIEPEYALRVAKGIDLDAFIFYAKNEPNLGRIFGFLTGLQRASRKLATRFVEQTTSSEIWKQQWDENEEFENVVHYARTLYDVNRDKGRHYVNFLVEQHRDDIFAIMDSEANLMLVSNWLRVIAMGDLDLAPDYVKRIADLALSVTNIDTRVWHLLEATEALIECKQKGAADQMRLLAAAETSQLRTVNNVRDWVVLFHKTLRIARELNRPDLPEVMSSRIEGWYFFEILGFESQPVLLAYLFSINKLIEDTGLYEIAHAIRKCHHDMLAKARAERSVVHKLLALILLGAPLEEIRKIAAGATWTELWSAGLTALIFANSYPEEAPLFSAPVSLYDNPSPTESEWQNLLMKETSDHRGNLEFALVRYLARLTGLSADLLSQLEHAANARMAAEAFERVRWLLRQESASPDLNARPFYVWAYLRDTVLRPTYLVNHVNV